MLPVRTAKMNAPQAPVADAGRSSYNTPVEGYRRKG
jgi:hypothetical protein